jgi:hypothetical protein
LRGVGDIFDLGILAGFSGDLCSEAGGVLVARFFSVGLEVEKRFLCWAAHEEAVSSFG